MLETPVFSQSGQSDVDVGEWWKVEVGFCSQITASGENVRGDGTEEGEKEVVVLRVDVWIALNCTSVESVQLVELRVGWLQRAAATCIVGGRVWCDSSVAMR